MGNDMRTARAKETTGDARDESSGLLASEVRGFGSRLVLLRTTLRGRIRAHTDPAREGEGTFSDELDQATMAQDSSLSLGLADRDEALLGEVEAALRRIDAGAYGVCEGTGEAIGYRRLEACPWTRNSVGYEEQREHTERARRGPR